MHAQGREPASLSVVIPTRDRALLLDECLRSVRTLEGPDLAVEIIVVVDHATDESRAVALQHAARVIDNPGSGAAAGRNTGMRAATGEFLLMVDDDDVVLPEHVRPHISLLRSRPDFMAVTGQAVTTDLALGERGRPFPRRLPTDGRVWQGFIREYPQIGAMVARTAVRESVGEQDERLAGDEDWDWQLRLAARHLVGFVPVPCLLFRQREPSATLEAGEWRRMGAHRKVLWRHMRAAGPRELPPWAFAGIALKQRGAYAATLVACARAHARDGERTACARALARGFVASPPHAAKALLVKARPRMIAAMATATSLLGGIGPLAHHV